MSAAELLRAARRRHDLSQAELAARAGTSQPVVSAYERGRRDPTVGTLRRLIAASGERLVLTTALPAGDVPPPESAEEHARRLLAVLSLADAVPPRHRSPRLDAPRMASR
jgi:transcriptional regulator with XRE-family HTH domain